MLRHAYYRLLLVLLVIVGSPAAAQTEKVAYKLGLIPGEAKDKRQDIDVLNAATDAFVAARRFTMLERKQLDSVFTEKDLQEFIGGQTNNKLSDVLGLDFLGIVGYTVDATRTADGRSVTAWIIDVRLIDVKTARLVTTISSARPGMLLPPANAREAGKLLFQSVRDAFPPFGYVVQAAGQEAVVDLGSEAGLKNGDVLEIVQEGEQIIHPVTGQVIPSPLKVVGELKVVSADLQLAKCKRKAGTTEIKPADRVRLKPTKSMMPDWLPKVPQFRDILKRTRDGISN